MKNGCVNCVHYEKQTKITFWCDKSSSYKRINVVNICPKFEKRNFNELIKKIEK